MLNHGNKSKPHVTDSSATNEYSTTDDPSDNGHKKKSKDLYFGVKNLLTPSFREFVLYNSLLIIKLENSNRHSVNWHQQVDRHYLPQVHRCSPCVYPFDMIIKVRNYYYFTFIYSRLASVISLLLVVQGKQVSFLFCWNVQRLLNKHLSLIPEMQLESRVLHCSPELFTCNFSNRQEYFVYKTYVFCYFYNNFLL